MKNTTHPMEQMVGQEIGHQRIKKLLIKCSLAQIMSKTIFNGPPNLFGLLVQRIFDLSGSLKFPWICLFMEKYVERVAFSSKPSISWWYIHFSLWDLSEFNDSVHWVINIFWWFFNKNLSRRREIRQREEKFVEEKRNSSKGREIFRVEKEICRKKNDFSRI